MEVMIGKEQTADALTTPLVEDLTVKSIDWEGRPSEFTFEEDGVFYIGFLVYNAGYMSCVYIDDIEVEGMPFLTSPEALTTIEAVPDPTGVTKATITFRLPEISVDGEKLCSLNGVRIRDGYVEIADLKNVKPGETVTYTTDNLGTPGYHTFNIVAYSDIDEGVAGSKTLFVGLDTPGTSQNVVLHDNLDRSPLLAIP